MTFIWSVTRSDRERGAKSVQLSFDRVRERSVDEDGYCGAFACVPGPLDASTSLSTLRMSVRLATAPERSLQVGVYVSGITAGDNHEEGGDG